MTMSRFAPVLALTLVLALSPVQGFAAADAKASPEEAVNALATTVPEEATSPDDVAGPAAATDEAEDPIQAAEEHGEGGLPQLNISTYPSQIFWLLVSFAVLYAAFSKSILPTIGGVVDARDGMIKGNLNEAERMRNEAEEVRISYEKNLEAARANAIKAVQDVEIAAKKKAADQAESFRKKADENVKGAESRLDAQKDIVMADMKNVAAEVASIAAEKITGVGADIQKAKAIVDSIADKAKAA